MDVFVSSDEDERAMLPGIIEDFFEGDGAVGHVLLSAAESAALRRRFDVSDDDFLIVILDDAGQVRERYRSPVKTSAVLEALKPGQEERP